MDSSLQTIDYTQLVVYGLPGIVLGISVGYIIGGQRSLRTLDRVGIGLAVGVIGGIIIPLMLDHFTNVSPGDFGIIMSILATTMGAGFGVIINWAPTPRKDKTRRVVFDPDEDDREFERQLKEFTESDS